MTEYYITPDQLCVGLYIQLDLGWMDHPFTFSSFKIKSQEQIDVLRRMQLQRIKYDPKKCSAKPLAASATPVVVAAPANIDQVVDAARTQKIERIEQLRTIRANIEQVEQKFIKVTDTIKNINKQIQSNPEAAVKETNAVVKQMVDTMLSGGDIMLHAISEKLGEEAYFHSLNVSVLSLMLGKAADLSADEIQEIGLGAVLHDIGKTDLPYKIVTKTDPLTKAEHALMETHCELGMKQAAKLKLSRDAFSIICQHHECVDGSGYPLKLSGDAISVAARVVSIANTYDNLCNPINIANAITPSEALSQMFALKRAKFDDRLLMLFIKRLGVYPPGSLIQLSNELIGLVVSVNSEQPLRPNVMVYDPTIPKDAALIISLESESDLKVAKSIRPVQLSRQVHQYLNPRKNVTYYFDAHKKGTSK